MADFKTHLTVTSIFSSIASTILMASSLAGPKDILLYFVLGVTGGLLPDIDADNSIPVRLLFTFMAFVIAFCVMFKHSADNSAVELFLVWLTSFVAIKHLVFSLFTRITVHRGIIHSVPAGVLFGLLTVTLLHRVFRFGEFTAWMAGLFLCSGYILHLMLDELCSLNLSGNKPKKSSGTAFKFINSGDLKTTAFVYIAVILLCGLTPDHKAFVTKITDSVTYRHLEIFPRSGWFRELCNRSNVALSKP